MTLRASARRLVVFLALASLPTCRAAHGSDERPDLTPLMLAARDGKRDRVVELIAGGADPEQVDTAGWNAINYAAAWCRAEVVAVLLHHGAHPDHATLEQMTPVMQLATAPVRGLPAMKVLIDGGANVNLKSSSGKTALHFAALYGNGGAIRLLLAAGADADPVDEDGWSPLMLAARRGQGPAAKLLIEAGADPNRSSRLGWTALTDCAGRGRHKMVARLLAAGAHVDLPDSDGRSPLWWAAQYGAPKVAKLLLAAGADPNGKGGASTPLWAAAASGNDAVLQMLIAAGADVGRADGSGLTPLMVAACEGQVDAVRRLLAAGADPSASSRPGEDALALAQRHHRDAIVALLEHGHGARSREPGR